MWVLCTALLLLAAAAHAQSANTFAGDRTVRVFADEVAARRGLSRGDIERLLSQARRLPEVIERISSPAEALPWYRYRPIFLTRQRIAAGVRFWKEHHDTLARARRTYGVAPEYIVAILGVETLYGRRTGHIRALDSLATLAFDYPPRAAFFKRELEDYFVLVHDEHLDALSVKGSYAGALGLPQFIPSSYLAYAVDFNGDGVRDLLGSVDDSIGSVANYLARHGWAPGGPSAVPAVVHGDVQALVAKGSRPRMTIAQLGRAGVRAQGDQPAGERAALVELEQRDGKAYWVGFQNFYTITRYNHSNLYAMAVTQLAHAIRDAYRKGGDGG